jgi:Tol biopolymer transport system component/tRNA A-37 threonylcarbamoyl transferase component Bud32
VSSPVERLTAALADRYSLERSIGEGGMATVYLAEDLRHHRKVAIKVLHPELSAVIGADRFLKEIELTASLQHPHILALYDSGTADGLLYYVMPFVEGETLRGRLERERQLPIADAVRITTQVTQALDYAHRRGIVHRDIKPENILLHEESAVVADFGIALAVQQAGGSRLTETGLSLGTPHYMSPEQAMGERNLDARTDIYALGAVAYEMLAGEPPFTGGSAQAIVAKVITEKPAPLGAHRESVPAHVAAAIHLALSKLAADRWTGAREFAAALEDGGRPAWPAAAGPTLALPAAHPTRRGPVRMAALLMSGSLALGAVLGWMVRRPPIAPETRLEVLRGDQGVGGIAFAPDGRSLAASSPGADGRLAIAIRRLDRLALQPLPGTERGSNPAYSPDGRQLAFLREEGPRQTSLWRIALDRGVPVRLSDSAASGGNYGAPSWGRDGWIYFIWKEGILARVRETGGAVEQLAVPDAAMQGGFAAPQVLPDGRAVLLTLLRIAGVHDRHEFGVWDLTTRKFTALGRGFAARTLGDGHLLYVDAARVLYRVPFDAERRQLAGAPEPIADQVRATLSSTIGVTASPGGDIAYRADTLAGVVRRRMVRVDGVGRVTPLSLPPDLYSSFRLAPDGRQLAVEITAGGNDGGNILILPLGDSVLRPLSRKGVNNYPVWSPDGRRVAWSRLLDGQRELVWQAADGTDTATVLLRRPGDQWQVEFVAGTDRLVVRDGNATGGTQNLDILSSRIGIDSAVPLAALPNVLERAPRVSPDGRWLAYVSNETGRDEVFVRPASGDGSGGGYQVTDGGGSEPVWSRSGKALFYKSRGSLMRGEIGTGATFSLAGRRRLFDVTSLFNNPWHARYEPLPGDASFLAIEAWESDADESTARTILIQHPASGFMNP